jgi:hypothetical protein
VRIALIGTLDAGNDANRADDLGVNSRNVLILNSQGSFPGFLNGTNGTCSEQTIMVRLARWHILSCASMYSFAKARIILWFVCLSGGSTATQSNCPGASINSRFGGSNRLGRSLLEDFGE